ncbi:putative pectate lyase [Capsicum annuum]|nr:putative pectate lyase [Capsicum annuum]
MALQTGIGLGRIIFIMGAGYTGTVLFQKGKLSDVIGELQNFVRNYEKSGETDAGDSDLAAQVRKLTMEVHQFASARSITVLNGNSSGHLTGLIIPTATVGALGYGYMWWKGLSFSDLMYVTKKSMTNAVSNLTKHLEHVSEALASTKRHLTQRIENVDGKLDNQMDMSKLLRSEVNDVRGDLSEINSDLDELQRMVSGLDGKLLSLEGKQELANAGVMYLCNIVNGKRVKMPDTLQLACTSTNSTGYLPPPTSNSYQVTLSTKVRTNGKKSPSVCLRWELKLRPHGAQPNIIESLGPLVPNLLNFLSPSKARTDGKKSPSVCLRWKLNLRPHGITTQRSLVVGITLSSVIFFLHGTLDKIMVGARWVERFTLLKWQSSSIATMCVSSSIGVPEGLKDLADSLPQGNSNRYLTDGVAEDGSLKSNDPPRSLLMRYSACSNFLFYSFFWDDFYQVLIHPISKEKSSVFRAQLWGLEDGSFEVEQQSLQLLFH